MHFKQIIQMPTSASAGSNISQVVDTSHLLAGSAVFIEVDDSDSMSAAYTIEGSADGDNWFDVSKLFFDVTVGAGTPLSASAITTQMLVCSVTAIGLKLRIKCTAHTSGTPSGKFVGQYSSSQ